MTEDSKNKCSISCSFGGFFYLAAIIWICWKIVGCTVNLTKRHDQVDVSIRMQDGSVTNAIVERQDISRKKGNVVSVSMPDGQIIETWQQNVTAIERKK